MTGFLQEQRMQNQHLTWKRVESKQQTYVFPHDVAKDLMNITADILEIDLQTALNFCGLSDNKYA